LSLLQWHERLERHFLALSESRRGSVSAGVVFALEHGLEAEEIKALSKAVRADVVGALPSRGNTLPWIVYAAELGYRYSGDEYWHTFEAETPGWTVNGDRDWIRKGFKSFQKKFHGAKPTGPWAAHFSIICWPITHAILPCDLQRQLARLLYDLRHSFHAELLESPEKLGEFIASQSWSTTSRFQQLAEKPLLLGQIATALLLQGEVGTDTLIHPETLRRIRSDLEKERLSREWLRGARQQAKERVQIRGLGSGRTSSSTPSAPHRRPEEAREELAALGIEPRLVLRPTSTDAANWDVLLEIPDLSQLLLRFPSTRETLTRSRCTVAGAAGNALARGRVLYGPQRVTLARWPKSDQLLLSFDPSDPQLEFLLRTECLLRPGPKWLFRIASDGLAYEVRSQRVRPGERYILVTTVGALTSLRGVWPITLACEGATGVIFTLPEALGSDWENTLRHYGLSQARAIEVWPAGLAPLAWDGEGYGEWLASERPCLAIRADHAIDALVVSLGNPPGDSIEIAPMTEGQTAFVELPPLPVGLHTVRLRTRGGKLAEDSVLGALNVFMRIRQARTSGTGANRPLVVQLEPPVPTLEQLWDGNAEITVFGPTAYELTCRASLFSANDGTTAVKKTLPPIPLPITPHAWRDHFEKHFRRLKDVQEAYDDAGACELVLTADELGAATARFERTLRPVRWALRKRHHAYALHLLDDTGSGAQPEVKRFAFETPSNKVPLPVLPEYDVEPLGGLYVARAGSYAATIVVPPTIRGKGFADLRCAPVVAKLERNEDSFVSLVELCGLWGRARLPGDPLAGIRQSEVMRALTHALFSLIGGEKWAAAEEYAVRDAPNGFMSLKHAVTFKAEAVLLAEHLATECAALASAPLSVRVQRIAALAEKHASYATATLLKTLARMRVLKQEDADRIAHLTWFSEFALRLASDPAGVESWAGKHLRFGAKHLPPTLARAARFFVLSIDRHLQSRVSEHALYAGWVWE